MIRTTELQKTESREAKGLNIKGPEAPEPKKTERAKQSAEEAGIGKQIVLVF